MRKGDAVKVGVVASQMYNIANGTPYYPSATEIGIVVSDPIAYTTYSRYVIVRYSNNLIAILESSLEKI